MPDILSDPILSHPYAPFIAIGGALLLLFAAASRWRFVRRIVSLGLYGLLAFALWSTIQTGAMFNPTLEKIASFADQESQEVVGEELRVPMAADGHFWVDVSINGTRRKMLVDSGATVTAIPASTAAEAGLDQKTNLAPVILRTANGTVTAKASQADEVRIGNIVARDLGVIISPGLGDTHVLGMNFLTRLESWRVEGRTLILKPHHPQPVEAV